MRRRILVGFIFVAALVAFIGISYGREVIIIPRLRDGLPRIEMTRPGVNEIERQQTLPFARLRLDPAFDTVDIDEPAAPSEPALISSIGTRGRIPGTPEEIRRPRLRAERFFYVTGRVRNMGWARVYLFERRGGFFELYGDEEEMELLGADYMDAEGNFRIGPIETEEGWLRRGRDVVLVLELDSPYAIAYSEMYGTVRPFRFRLASRNRVTPEGGNYNIGTIDIDWSRREYYPVRAYKSVIDRLRERDRLDEKIRVEFTRDVNEPRYMEEIGYILMPYSER